VRPRFWLLGLLLAIAAWGFGFVRDYFDRDSPAHLSMQYTLKVYGQAIYEHHDKTGQWPQRAEDLAGTSLVQVLPHWRETASLIVLVPHADLKSDPRQNASVIIAFYRGGLFSKLGRVWVCWGDLRTGYVPVAVLSPERPKN
jgi:hypothetical protein